MMARSSRAPGQRGALWQEIRSNSRPAEYTMVMKVEEAFVEKMGEALEDIGFFALTGHGIPLMTSVVRTKSVRPFSTWMMQRKWVESIQ